MMLNGTDNHFNSITSEITSAPLYIQASTERTDEISENFLLWAIIDSSLMLLIFAGNTLTILAISLSRRIRSITSNLFILSLAISDILVGTTLPYHLAFYMSGTTLGSFHTWCLMRFFVIIIACTVSIWNLIAIAVDRYIAIVYPLHYVRYITRRVALIVISMGWVLGVTIGIVPMFWNNWPTANACEFDEILPPWYMAGMVTPLFSAVWICMMVLYAKIWHEASRHTKQLRSSFSGLGEGNVSDWKSMQVVLLILGCFSICWLPYFIVACSQIFKIMEYSSPNLYKAAFSMAMANSGMNPIIYAWKNSTFRQAFGRLLRFRSPDYQQCMLHMNRTTTAPRRSCTMDQIQDVSTNEPSTTTTITTNHPLVADDFVAVTNFEGSAVKLDDHRPSLTQLFHDRDRCYANRYPAELPCNAAILNSSKCVAVEHDDSNGNRIVNIVENHEILGGYVSVSATIVAMHVSSTTDGAEESTRPQDV